MSDASRPNPDALLASLQRQETQAQRGRLKVFFGMAPGVGKTYAMLEAARREQAAGRDVVIGYVETHGRKETDALTEGLPILPRRVTEYRGVALTEMDIDAMLARRPQLALVDEFAHTNAPGSRHSKRCQDVQELLDAGLNVFTTLNVQHLESRADAVRQITGITIQETVPDTALASAELELVDLPPDDLRARLAAGRVYLPDRAATARDNFFRPGNLSALRELALRFVAEHVGQDVRDYRLTHGIADPWKSGQRLLVAVSPSPTSASLVRWACRLAGELKAPWVAAYVEFPRLLETEEQKRLTEHLALARELGAEIITTSDSDIVAGLLRVAREQNVTQLVVGKPAGWRALDLFRGGSFLNRLIQASGDIDVHAVRAEHLAPPRRGIRPPACERWDWRDLLTALGSVAGVTCVGLLLKPWTGYQAIALVYLLAVVVLGLFVRRGAVFVASLFSALLWNLLFVPPLFTFRISSAPDWMSFLALLIVGLAVGQLTARLRAQQIAERSREQRTSALYRLTRALAECKDPAELLAVAARQLGDVFRADVAMLLPPSEDRGELVAYPFGTLRLTEKDEGVADWAFRNAKPAGHGTDTLASTEALFLPLMTPTGCAGVAGLRFREGRELSPPESHLLESFIRQIALTVDRARLRDAESRATLLAESERLGRTLLNSVSHELRTPLTAIAGAAEALATTGRLTDGQKALTDDIQSATARLNQLVQNLLGAARIQAGQLHPVLDWCDVGDVVNAALKDAAAPLALHPISTSMTLPLPLLRLDFTLTEQALANLLVNAGTHTPPGTPVEIAARVDGRELVLSVADHGSGLPPGEASRLFELFQRAPDARPGGTGLGLSIARGFVEAQGGRVEAANRPGGGAIFSLRLPVPPVPDLPEEPA